jgi:hypothetical protein
MFKLLASLLWMKSSGIIVAPVKSRSFLDAWTATLSLDSPRRVIASTVAMTMSSS